MIAIVAIILITWTPKKLTELSEVLRDDEATQDEPKEYKLCLVGAGIAGLYIALILDTLKINHISFEFFEASDSIGGRCFTFPEINVVKVKGGVNCPILFNDVRLLKSGVSPDWTTNPFDVDSVSNMYARRDPGSIMSEVRKEYFDALNENPAKGFEKLMEGGIEYLETFAGSTTSFNGAFSEYVIDSINVAAEKQLCIEGDVEVLSKNVWWKLRTKPQIKKKVTRIAREKTTSMLVGVEGESEDRRYDTVLCNPTLGCMQKMDLTSAQLNWGEKCAIRGLTYGPSTKVAIRFSRPWWITELRHHVGWLRVHRRAEPHLRLPVLQPSRRRSEPRSPTLRLLVEVRHAAYRLTRPPGFSSR
ncbi:hypothetical protein DL762_002917 [Monosporascus cannonballus]|uniref:Amine oxidase domain-containing protein n=1 Tax=Monosporascus cannonballus TaxID=155416 RepID=A0ABY0HC09_9PEZI|nr:hypothetical protein DL762_002917 [Monosporascus cannonballus]RYO97285.1 hypothetical protein DL763_002834 [Monosporascus cannonballus]